MHKIISGFFVVMISAVVSWCELQKNHKVPPVRFRSTPVEKLTTQDVKKMLETYDFYCRNHSMLPSTKEYSHPKGQGFGNMFEKQEGGVAVVDHASGLMWQQAGSTVQFRFQDALKYIENLNELSFGGFTDWRLPTLEEAMSLMEPKRYGTYFHYFYIDKIFDREQALIWTADKANINEEWVVDFNHGDCFITPTELTCYVRAVRTVESSFHY